MTKEQTVSRLRRIKRNIDLALDLCRKGGDTVEELPAKFFGPVVIPLRKLQARLSELIKTGDL